LCGVPAGCDAFASIFDECLKAGSVEEIADSIKKVVPDTVVIGG
jgi:hypothetical protein